MGNKNKSHLDRFKHIHAYCSLFRHIQAHSGIILAYLESYVKLETDNYSELYQTSTMERFAKILNSFTVAVFANQNYFRNTNISRSLLFLIKVYFLFQKHLFYIKKYVVHGVIRGHKF